MLFFFENSKDSLTQTENFLKLSSQKTEISSNNREILSKHFKQHHFMLFFLERERMMQKIVICNFCNILIFFTTLLERKS